MNPLLGGTFTWVPINYKYIIDEINQHFDHSYNLIY